MHVSWIDRVPEEETCVILLDEKKGPELLQKAIREFAREDLIEVVIDKNRLVTYIAVRRDVGEGKGRRLGQRLHEKKITRCTLLLQEEKDNHLFMELLLSLPIITTIKSLFVVGDKELIEKTIAKWKGVNLAKSLTNAPSNVLYPRAYAEKVQESLGPLGVLVTIYDDVMSLDMHAMYGAGQGSEHAPCMIVLEWKGSVQDPIALVGKGVCFDSGGLCLKTSMQQRVMKYDKAGASVIAGLFYTLAMMKTPIHVVGILGMIENMPDGKAIKPGDVLSSLSGLSIEIVDTDAEGRLVLADCLTYAEQYFHPKILIDLGTLTIETRASLGEAFAGLYTEDKQLSQELCMAGKMVEEQLWPLPMGPYFAKQIISPVADVKNSGCDLCGENGAAAEFLKRFISPTIPWAHIDLSGVAWTDQGVTGFGVLLLEQWMTLSIR